MKKNHVHDYKMGESKTVSVCQCGKFRHEGTFTPIVEVTAAPSHTPTLVEDIDSGDLLQVAKFALDCIVEQNFWDEEHSETGPTLQNKNAETLLRIAIAKAEGR